MNDADTLGPQRTGPAAPQETDAWWGGYTGWTMLPSMLVCLALTALIVGGAWVLVERRQLQATIWSAAGLVWLVQMTRFCSRVFGTTYRLTTRRLVSMRGHIWRQRREMELGTVAKVAVKQRGIPFGINLGSIVATGIAGQRLVLDGVRQPDKIAARIRALVLSAAASSDTNKDRGNGRHTGNAAAEPASAPHAQG